MNPFLEHIWNSLQMQDPYEQSHEKRQLIHEMNQKQAQLRAELDETHLALFEKCSHYADLVQDIAEREAFIQGIRFATQFLAAGFYND